MNPLEPSPPLAPLPAPVAPPPVWIFGLLIVPYALVSTAFVNTVLPSLLHAERVPLSGIANVNALLVFPSAMFFLWSPLVDFWLRRRTWVALASVLAGLLLGMALQFKTIAEAAPRTLILMAMCVVMLIACGTGGLMASVLPAGQKRRGSAFYQAGSMGLGSLGGGGLLYLSQHIARRPFGLVCGLAVALPGLLSLTIAEPPVVGREERLRDVLGRVGREFKHTFLKRGAVPVLLMACAPMASGAALGLLPGLAPEYGVSINSVAWINGAFGGSLLALGALLSGFLKLPEDTRSTYCLAGLVNAVTLGILLLGHPRPATYLWATALYLLSLGACYAIWVALSFKLLGVSGKSAGSRYAIAQSLGNIPTFYMALVDGLGARWFGVKGLPAIDMIVSGLWAIAFLLWFWWERRKGIVLELGLVPEEC